MEFPTGSPCGSGEYDIQWKHGGYHVFLPAPASVFQFRDWNGTLLGWLKFLSK